LCPSTVAKNKLYYSGIHPLENPSFDTTLLENFHMTHLGENNIAKMHDYDFVDIFVENAHLVHTAFTHNPAKNSHPYNPKNDVVIEMEEMKGK
jgi:hypothetical protein